MTADEVRARVAVIRERADVVDDDPESLHREEDVLYVDVLRAIADGADNASELASIALEVDEMGFSRWYA